MLHNPRRIAQFVALGLAVLAYLAVVLLPTYAGTTTDSDGTVTATSSTALEVNGPGILLTLAIPLVLTAVPVLARGRAWLPVSITCLALLIAFAGLTVLSLGVFFLPATVAAIAAVVLPARSRRAAA